jgi:hypothetical protein
MDHFPIQAYVHTPKMLVPYFALHNNFWGPPQGLQSDPAFANTGTGPLPICLTNADREHFTFNSHSRLVKSLKTWQQTVFF